MTVANFLGHGGGGRLPQPGNDGFNVVSSVAKELLSRDWINRIPLRSSGSPACRSGSSPIRTLYGGKLLMNKRFSAPSSRKKLRIRARIGMSQNDRRRGGE